MSKNHKNIDISYGARGILFTFFAALVVFAAYIVLGAVFSSSRIPLGLCLILLYTGSVLIFFILTRQKPSRSTDSVLNPVLGNIMLDTVTKLNMPVIICDEAGDRIIWYNRMTANLTDSGKSLYGLHFADVFDFDATPDGELVGQDIPELENADIPGDALIPVGLKDRIFMAKSYKVKTAKKNFVLYALTDVTQTVALKREMENRDVVVAYIMVDNLDDLLQHEQEEYRSAASKTEGLLREWAQASGGVLKEYQQDRYLFVFESKKLSEFVAHRFDILDKIRDVRAGESKTPVTVSIGVGAVHGTFADREKAAQVALDMALQRGGDQVILKSDSATDIYGGKTKIAQKRTKVRARVVANELVTQISCASNVIIMGHKYADFDAFGACVGLARLCMFCGVTVNIVTDFADVNLDRPRSWLADEAEYDGVFVTGSEALDLVQTETLLILADVNNRAMFEKPELFDACGRVAVIDHHRKISDYETEPLITYIEPNASAASELVAEMLEQVLPPSMLLLSEADLLMSGILLDTKQFTKNTGSRTFSAALYLRDRGADVGEVQEFFKTTLDDYMREAKFLTNIVIYRSVTAIALGSGEGDAGDRIVAAKAADKLLGVEGVQASFALIVIDGAIHISARSQGKMNVQLILESLRGGGHFDSAGAQLSGVTLEEALALLKAAIDKYLDN